MQNKMRLSVFAFHVSQIMGVKAPVEFGLCPFAGLKMGVKIDTTDQVWIDGTACGNRNGGVGYYTEMVCAANPEIILD